MKCVKCNSEIDNNAQFCPYCGKAVEHGRLCVKCGKPLDDDSDFCPYCGTKQNNVVVEPEQVEEIQPQEPELVQEGPALTPVVAEQPQEPEIVQEEPEPKPVVVKQPQEPEEKKVESEPPSSSVQEETVDTIQPYVSKPTSKKWLWIIGSILLLGVIVGIGIYGVSRMGQDADSEEAKEFIESMYKDFFENENFDTENIANLHKYLSPSVAEKLKKECPYDGGEGDFSYVVYFFVDGSLSWERPDYGDKVVSRTIESEKDGWFMVTNIWDVIQEPVKVRLQVKSVDGALKIVDINIGDAEIDSNVVEEETKGDDGLTKNDVWTLGECPQKIDGLSVELSMNDDYVQTVKITKDGKLLQVLGGEDEESFYEGSPMVFDNSMVYYVDANFDGYTDIFIGTGDDRTENTILLWNSDKNLFERYGKIGEPSLMNPYFSPSEKAIYECGKNGFYDYGYSKSIWKNGELVNQESLEEIIIQEGFDYDSYNEGRDYKRSKKYALFDSNNKLIVETNEIDELPNKWAEIIKR